MADEPTVVASPPTATPTAAEQIAAVKLDPARAQVKEDAPKTLADALGRKTVKVVDADGIDHFLPALRVRDIEDLEQTIEGMGNFWRDESKVAHAVEVIWLSARNEGLTRDQRLKREWRYAREDVADMLVLSVPQILALAADILANSGFVTKVSPLAETPPKTETGENSSPAA